MEETESNVISLPRRAGLQCEICGSEWFYIVSTHKRGAVKASEHGEITAWSGRLACVECLHVQLEP